jgi:hypothetical protein
MPHTDPHDVKACLGRRRVHQELVFVSLLQNQGSTVGATAFWCFRQSLSGNRMAAALTIFFPSATTCPLWTSWSPLPVVAEV